MKNFGIASAVVIAAFGCTGVSAQPANFLGGQLTVSFSARASLNDATEAGSGTTPPPARITVRNIDSGAIQSIQVGGLRPRENTTPRSYVTTGAWTIEAGDATPLGSVSRNFQFTMYLPGGNYYVSAQSGAYLSRFTPPPNSSGDPVEPVEILDSYYVENFQMAALPASNPGSGGGSSGGSTSNLGIAGATYTVTWSAASGGTVTPLGNDMTITLPYGGGTVGLTATATSTDGGIVRKLRIVRVATGQVLAETSGSAASLNATAVFAVDNSSAPDRVRAVAMVDGRMGSRTASGIAFTTDAESGSLRLMAQFFREADPDGMYMPNHLAPMTVKNSSGTTVWSWGGVAGSVPPGQSTGVLINFNTTGGYQVDYGERILMMPQYFTIGVLPPGTYTATLGAGHTNSQEFDPRGNGIGRLNTLDWMEGDSAVIGPVEAPGIDALVTVSAPPPTPMPTPTPNPAAYNPAIQWLIPVGADNNQDIPQSQWPNVLSQTTVRVGARGVDTSGMIYPVASVTLEAIANPYSAGWSQQFDAPTAAGSAAVGAARDFYVRFPAVNAFVGYQFRARAVNTRGEWSPWIYMTVTAYDRDLTAETRTWQAYIVDYGTSNPYEAVRGNAPVALIGGIAAMGSAPRGETSPLVSVTPSAALINGTVIPPLMPWVVDLRIKSYDSRVYQAPADPAARPSR